MKTTLFALAFFLIAGCQSKQPQYIAVDGIAKARIPVDYFQVRVTIKTEAATLSAANKENKALVLRFFDILTKYSIPDSDFVTKSSQTSESFLPSYMRFEREKRLPSVEYTGELTLRQTNLYDALFKDAVALGKLEIGVFGFGSFQLENFKQKAYQEATANAKARAELLLSGTGQRVDKIFKILQDGRDRYRDYDDIETIIDSKRTVPPQVMAMMAQPEPSTFRKQYFDEQVNVTIIYEIE